MYSSSSAQKTSARRSRQRGMSLVELLVCLAVIGTLVHYLAPHYHRLADRAGQVRQQRNAQIIASVASAALGAGAKLDLTSVNSLVSDLNDGVSGSGALAHMTFKVPSTTLLIAADHQTLPQWLEVDAESQTVTYRAADL